MKRELAKAYNPEGVENKWYPIWNDSGAFAPKGEADTSFSIVIPPPNVTGVLHMGHALNSTLQDVLVRYHRMRGDATLWIPGMDHAGIATQSVVEKKLYNEGTDKYDLGREDFVQRVWQWKEEHGGIIQRQLREMGHSPDWSHERFTLDEGLSKAVRKVFVQLYQEGLIYRGQRIINWCPMLRTALSDEEVVHKDLQGKLYYFYYPISGSDQKVTLATTRPETMLGDSAVAFHPDDRRYQHLKGQKVLLPLLNREIPFVADEFVDPQFGSGLVKVTPAHDPNDFEIGKRHNLPEINILDEQGYVNENGGPYQGMYRFEAREKIIEDLKEQGLLIKIENHDHAVGHCYRTDDVIEPYLTRQWFVNMKPLADPAIQAVKEGRIQFHPENWTKTYLHWMENIRDWCISRQLWWGHRVPAWYCQDCGYITVTEEDPDKCEKCGSSRIEQDEDVLDTWFSSALWPFSTMGWPEQTETLARFYPTSVLVTAFDIIFFWVARMIFMGIKFMDEVPFKDVLIHGLVLDQYGQKQSKSKGNVVNPLEMMYRYGTDAFRFTIAISSSQGRGVRWNEDNVSAYRNFANKIWNAARFIFLKAEEFDIDVERYQELPPHKNWTDFDHWILGRLSETTENVQSGIINYRIGDAAAWTYEFIWKEFCDWYIELAKDYLRPDGEIDKNQREYTFRVLIFTLKNALKLLHPFMPFITEELYSYIQDHTPEQNIDSDKLLITAPWPDKSWKEMVDGRAAKRVALFQELVYKIRNIRGEMNVAPNVNVTAIIIPDSDNGERYRYLLESYQASLLSQAKLESINLDEDYSLQKSDARAALSGATVAIPLEGVIDFAKERDRLQRALDKVVKDLKRVEAKLENQEFLANAPAEVVDKEQAKQQELKDLLQRYNESLEAFSEEV